MVRSASGCQPRPRWAILAVMKFDVGILATQPVPEIVSQVRLAERLGYDTAWIADTHLVCRELWVTLAACAAATSRIRLGPGVTVPHSRHLSVTASALATLHDLAPGRVVAGVGTGGSSAETMGLRLRDVARVSTLETLTTSIRRLLAGTPARFENGHEGRLAWLDAPCHVPLYLAGSGPRMLTAAGRLGDGAIVYASTSPSIVRAALDVVAAGAAERGRRLADLDVALWAPMSIARDGALARDHARGRVASALRHPLPVSLPPEDQAVVDRLRAGYDSFQHASAGSAHRALVPDRFVELFALAGAPDDVAAQVRGLQEVAGLDRIIILPQVPDGAFMDRETILTLFADEVIAKLGECGGWASR
jgi:5,10-methylenetetrahydromethanopterin reductase